MTSASGAGYKQVSKASSAKFDSLPACHTSLKLRKGHPTVGDGLGLENRWASVPYGFDPHPFRHAIVEKRTPPEFNMKDRRLAAACSELNFENVERDIGRPRGHDNKTKTRWVAGRQIAKRRYKRALRQYSKELERDYDRMHP